MRTQPERPNALQIREDRTEALPAAVLDGVDILGPVGESHDELALVVDVDFAHVLPVKPGAELFHEQFKAAALHGAFSFHEGQT
jgi:hypothetical protein